jgi:putative addiction module killer protein
LTEQIVIFKIHVINKLQFSYEIQQTATFRKWLKKLKDKRSRTIIVQRLVRLQDGLFGDTKSVGDGVGELRFHLGPGYRIYYTIRGSVIILLLCGGDKSTQSEDIALAKRLAKEIE